jgi:hypothetical protein
MASINISYFAGAGAQFSDDNGVPLVGGLLYIYAAGTTTPAVSYTTSSGTVNNTNPIVLDAGGRTPYQIWVNGGALYKFVLKNSAGVTVGTYDNIPSIDDPTAFNNIITVTGTNTLIGTSTPSNTAYVRGMTLSFVVVNTNTGAVTIDVDGLGAKEITFSGSNPLVAGQMTAGAIVTIEYDGTRFQLMNSSGALAITASSINGGQIAGFRNRIINGAMVIDQRNASGGITPTNFQYTVDRWRANLTQASKFTTQQNSGSVTPPVGYINYLGAVSTSAYSVGASDAFALNQAIEGLNVSDFGWGTANAKTITLSFLVRSSLTGTFGGAFQNSAQNRSYPFIYTISAANTWEQKTVTIAGDTSGTWLTSIGVGVNLFFSLGTGATFSGAAGSWSGANFFSATGATSVVGTNGATFYITGVQLELGVIATPFEQRLFGTELMLCQRYYESGAANELYNGTAGTVVLGIGTQFKATKRAAPTVTVSYGTVQAASAQSFYSYGSISASSWYQTVAFTASAEL